MNLHCRNVEHQLRSGAERRSGKRLDNIWSRVGWRDRLQKTAVDAEAGHGDTPAICQVEAPSRDMLPMADRADAAQQCYSRPDSAEGRARRAAHDIKVLVFIECLPETKHPRLANAFANGLCDVGICHHRKSVDLVRQDIAFGLSKEQNAAGIKIAPATASHIGPVATDGEAEETIVVDERAQNAKPRLEQIIRQMNEKRSGVHDVERLVAAELSRVCRGLEGLDAESVMLENNRISVNIGRHNLVWRKPARNVPCQSPVSAGELEETRDFATKVSFADLPNDTQRATTRVVIPKARNVRIFDHEGNRVVEHFIARVDVGDKSGRVSAIAREVVIQNIAHVCVRDAF